MRRIARPFFCLGLILYVFSAFAAAQTVPRTEEILGFKVGEDYHLATYTQAIAYFKKLADTPLRTCS